MATSRTSKAALQRSLQQSLFPVYLVTEDYRIAFANDAICQWTGVDAETLTESGCQYQSSADHHDSRNIANGLCPPPDSFGGPPVRFDVYCPGKTGVQFREAISCPVGETGRDVLVCVFGSPRPESATGSVPDDNRHRLHASIAQMQYQSGLQVNIDLVTGSSPAARKIRRQIQIAGQSGSNVVICGHPGSCRREVAHLIHFGQGPLMAGALIPIDCRVADAEMMQSVVMELYREQRQNPDEPLGRLLLEDLDSLSQAARNELAGFLDLPDFELPVLSTAGPDAASQVPDPIWQRLSTMIIELPGLVQRSADLPELLQSLLERDNRANQPQFAGFDQAALEFLQQYPWPGQLRELQQVVDQAREQATPPLITAADLPAHVRIAVRAESGPATTAAHPIELDRFLEDVELELIQRAMQVAGGNKSQAARLLGISRARLLRRVSDSGSRNETERDGGADA